MKSHLAAERLRHVLAYDLATGVFIWQRPNARGGAKQGVRAGCYRHADGYRSITVDRNNYLEHRLAWLYVHGAWPAGEVDHIDGNRSNNCFDNLREVTRQQNTWNNCVKRHSTSGVKGVEKSGNKWLARIRVNGQRVGLGSYDTIAEAAAVYRRAAPAAYGEHACVSDRQPQPHAQPPRPGRTKHGMRNSPEYNIWIGMRRRCRNPTDPAWADYGGRGITVCDRWQDFSAFYADMGPRPSPDHTLDREDNDKGYNKANCRWATWNEQAANRRSTRAYTLDGETLCISEWAIRFGVGNSALARRLNKGMSLLEAVRYSKLHVLTYEGRSQSIAVWARERGLNENTLRARILNRGWSVSDALRLAPSHRPLRNRAEER